MHRFLGFVLMAFPIAACQPQTNIQSDLQTLKIILPSISGTSQDENANVDVKWQETSIDAGENSLDADAAVKEKTQNFVAEPEGLIITTLSPATIEVSGLNEDETGEPLVTAEETGVEGAASTDNSMLQITNPTRSNRMTTVESESIITLKDALDEIDLAAIQPIDEDAWEPVVVNEPPKGPDPIHPQTIIGQTIDDLGTRLGLPDFERTDADVVIWQYRLASCVTDFYLYLSGDDYIVTGWAWRPPFVHQTLDEEICQQQIGTLLDLNV